MAFTGKTAGYTGMLYLVFFYLYLPSRLIYQFSGEGIQLPLGGNVVYSKADEGCLMNDKLYSIQSPS